MPPSRHFFLLAVGEPITLCDKRWNRRPVGIRANRKKGPGKFLPLARVSAVNLGLSFEFHKVSAQAVLERERKSLH